MQVVKPTSTALQNYSLMKGQFYINIHMKLTFAVFLTD